ncbi:MAG: hypothetical protein PHS80_05845 [Methanothrix sp.]|nr:hypothetical protein [Methanothrix sp.]
MFAPERRSLILTLLLAFVIVMVSPSSSSIYPFGSKVLPGDLDIGRPLFRLPAETTVAYWDIGTPGYDERDPVYLHIGHSASGTTNANDVRLTFIDNVSPGSKVAFQDFDMNKPLKQLYSIISFLDIHGSRAYDLDDPIYLHHIDRMDHSDHPDYICFEDFENPADMMTGFSERLPFRGREISLPGLGFAIFTDNYKLFISDKILDKKPRKVGEMRGLAIEMVPGLKANYFHVLGTWLIKIQIPKDDESVGSRWEDLSPQFIQTNDIRLSSMGNLIAGTKVTNFDADQNKILAWPPLVSFLGPVIDTAKLGFFDVNGNGVYDYEDDLYLNVPSGESKGVVTVNNVRLSGPIL